jgi:hypothetical protein
MSRNGSSVLPFTLTELFVLLFFALALALVWQSNARAEAEDDATQLREVLADAERTLGTEGTRELIRIIGEAEASIPEDFTELVRVIDEQAAGRDRLMNHLVEIGIDRSAIQQASTETLVDSLVSLHSRAEQQVLQMAAAFERLGQGGNALLMCTQDLAASENALVRAIDDLSNARNQAQTCFRRLGNGLDHPPCWADDAGRPEYAFTVTLFTSNITVVPAWPGHRADDADRVPGMRAASGDRMPYSEFASRVLPIFEWSQRQNPECRHFVHIMDQVEGGKNAFKRNLLTVERFFYKRLAN